VTAPSAIAVIKPCCIGDCVMALPAIDALSRAWPEAALDIFVGRHSEAVFRGDPRIASLRPISDQPRVSDGVRLAATLARSRYDAIVLLDRSLLLRTAVQRRIRRAQTALIERREHEDRHESEVYLHAVRTLGIDADPGVPLIHLSEADHATARAAMPQGISRYAVLHPGGAENPGSLMLSKRWPADRYVQVARHLNDQGLAVLFTGSGSELALASDIARAADISDRYVLAGSIDLMATAALIEHAALYVGPDTGVSHLAAATGAPCVVIFGPTNPRRYAPRGQRVIVLSPPASLELHDVDLRRPTTPDPSVVTSNVSVTKVIEACERWLTCDEEAAEA
jgi:heptosyltransferase II